VIYTPCFFLKVESLHAKIGGTTLHVMKAFFLWGEEGGLSKYKGKKHTQGGSALHNMDKLSIRHMKLHILIILSKLIIYLTCKGRPFGNED